MDAIEDLKAQKTQWQKLLSEKMGVLSEKMSELEQEDSEASIEQPKFGRLLLYVFSKGPVPYSDFTETAQKLGFDRIDGGWFKGKSELTRTFTKGADAVSLTKDGLQYLMLIDLVKADSSGITEAGKKVLSEIA